MVSSDSFDVALHFRIRNLQLLHLLLGESQLTSCHISFLILAFTGLLLSSDSLPKVERIAVSRIKQFLVGRLTGLELKTCFIEFATCILETSFGEYAVSFHLLVQLFYLGQIHQLALALSHLLAKFNVKVALDGFKLSDLTSERFGQCLFLPNHVEESLVGDNLAAVEALKLRCFRICGFQICLQLHSLDPSGFYLPLKQLGSNV